MKTILAMVLMTLGLTGLCSCSPGQLIPTEPAIGCEHVNLEAVLPGITTKEKSYRKEQQRNDKMLIPGQMVPDFTLTDISGNEVSLYDVLATRDAVLVDFWASWCGPCVRGFPTLRALRTEYGPLGFDVVAISIDRERDEWIEGSREHKVPWVNLGELKSWDGDVAVQYGVHFIPKSYLVDSHGCIMQKDLPMELLESVIHQRYSVVEPDATTKTE